VPTAVLKHSISAPFITLVDARAADFDTGEGLQIGDDRKLQLRRTAWAFIWAGLGTSASTSATSTALSTSTAVLGLKLTGRWGPPDIGRPICFMRIDDKHHDVVLFELPEDARRAGVAVTDSSRRRAPGLDHIAFEVDSREDWLLALDHVRSCGVEIVSGPYVHAPEGGEKGFVGGSGSHAFYFLDPDGNRIEVYCWMMKVTGPSLAAPHPDL
jgi:catechol 2,3-dioxygenase-like lactoylglutathione lyase family enzyme